jgi:hypothetical protein
MTPTDAEDLDDTIWDALVRRMITEAEAIKRANATKR